MPVINRIAALAPEMAEWRHWLHRHPELEFDLPKTSAFVAAGLDGFADGWFTNGRLTWTSGGNAA